MCQTCHTFAVDHDINMSEICKRSGKDCSDGTWNPMSHEVKVNSTIIGQASSTPEAIGLLENHKKSLQ